MKLKAVMYHYVRNTEETPYKCIHAVREDNFIQQVNFLKANYEMATSESIKDFLIGKYKPKKDMAVLTFDDGLKEHGIFVTEVLAKHGIQGQFFVPTACITEGYVLPVHKNHFLLASLNFSYYQERVIEVLKENYPDTSIEVDDQRAARTYRWDSKEVARFKYLLNYQLPKPVRNHILKIIFEQELGRETDFAKSLYLSWEEIKEMQRKGMTIGGHSHRHDVLSSLSNEEQTLELATCLELLNKNIVNQSIFPFSYPFGKMSTFNEHTIDCLKKHHVQYAYSTVIGDSISSTNPFILKRIDPKDLEITKKY